MYNNNILPPSYMYICMHISSTVSRVALETLVTGFQTIMASEALGILMTILLYVAKRIWQLYIWWPSTLTASYGYS